MFKHFIGFEEFLIVVIDSERTRDILDSGHLSTCCHVSALFSHNGHVAFFEVFRLLQISMVIHWL